MNSATELSGGKAGDAPALAKIPAQWRKPLCVEAARRTELYGRFVSVDDLVLEALEAHFQALKPQE